MFGPSSWPALSYYQSEGGIRMRDVVAGDADLRTDPQRDVRRLSIFAIGLLAAYAAALVLLWRQGSARNLGPLGRAFEYAPLAIVVSMTGAVAEEIGWRAFLWPLLRGRYSFALSSLIVTVVWWLFHVPAILLGWYGSLAGLPAFTVALVGMVLFFGVITDRSKSVWPSIVAHATWNALVLTGFAVAGAATEHAFSGSAAIVGEFGWLAAIASLALGLAATWWHLSKLAPSEKCAAVPLTPPCQS